MKRLLKKPWIMLAVILLVTIVASDWQNVNPMGSKPPTSVAKDTVREADRPALPHKANVMEVAAVRMDKLGHRAMSDVEMINVFNSKSWFVPPPPPPFTPPKPVPPPPPAAPPLPYTFLGSY
ncbi:MAG: hypothetical protein ABI475_09445, partial [Methylophilaceae bacterium]